MRLWLKDSERRRDPEPVITDDRKALLAGLVLWVIALVGLLLLGPALAPGASWWPATCAIGIVLGLIGLVYTHFNRG